MRIEPTPSPQYAADVSSAARTCTGEIAAPREDQLTLHASYQAAPAELKTNSRIERLRKQLESDEAYMKSPIRDFLRNPVGRELAKEIILANEDIQEQVAKLSWEIDQRAARANPNLHVPASYKDIDVKAALLSSDEVAVADILSSYDYYLYTKASTFGLTEEERLMGVRYETSELAGTGTFDQKMAPMLRKIEAAFEEAGMCFDREKSYSFYLDTSTFDFSVSGGTDEENALIAKVLNTSNYRENNELYVLGALESHRQPDGKYNPWTVERKRSPQFKIGIPVYGISVVTEEYSQKMKQLGDAHARCKMDQSLKAKYGFGFDDMRYQNGNIVGKTAEITQIIKDGGIEFMKNVGFTYIEILKTYTGTPEFPDAVFTFENGTFQTTYQVFEDESQAGTTKSSALLARVEEELARREDRINNAKPETLAGYAPRPKVSKSRAEALFQNLMQDTTFTVSDEQRFYQHPVGRQLAEALIMSDRTLQDQIAKLMYMQAKGYSVESDDLLSSGIYRCFNVSAMLLSGKDDIMDRVFRSYDLLLAQKSRSAGLSEMEELLFSAGHNPV